jgi:hypothetical protein
MSTVYNLLSLPTEIIISVIAAGRYTEHVSVSDAGPDQYPSPYPDGLLLTSLRRVCRRLRRLIDDNWNELVDIFTDYVIWDPDSKTPTTIYYFCGLRHRVGGPACVYEGYSAWWAYGQRHRSGDLPAIVSNNAVEWWYAGRCHRDGDLPAVYKDIGWTWYKHGVRSRDGGLPTSVTPAEPFNTIAARTPWNWYSDPSEPYWRGMGTYDWTQYSTLTTRLPTPARMSPCVLDWRDGDILFKSIVID